MTFDHERDETFEDDDFANLVVTPILVSTETYDWLIDQPESEEQ